MMSELTPLLFQNCNLYKEGGNKSEAVYGKKIKTKNIQ